jgi:hypothetical protein
MTWSYSGNPSTSAKDEVRFLVGDTDTTEQLVQDEEINYALAEQPNTRLAAANVADSIGAKFSRKTDVRLGDYTVSYNKLASGFFTLANQLRNSSKNNAGIIAIPYAGGISQTEIDTSEQDTDLVQPKFKVDMMTNEGDIYDSES